MENGRPVIAFYGGEITRFRLDFENEDSGTPIDLTGKVVTFSYRPHGGGAVTTVTADTPVDPTLGSVYIEIDLSALASITILTVYTADIWIEDTVAGTLECQGLVTMNLLPAVSVPTP